MREPNSKAAAAYTLSDELVEIELWLERSETVLHEITDNYFVAYDPKTERGRFGITLEYVRNGIFADIATDYLFKIRKALAELSELSEAGRQYKGREGSDNLFSDT